MRRVKILLTNDGNFHFDDIDKELYARLKREGIPFKEPEFVQPISLSRQNLQKRLKNPNWWRKYLI